MLEIYIPNFIKICSEVFESMGTFIWAGGSAPFAPLKNKSNIALYIPFYVYYLCCKFNKDQ